MKGCSAALRSVRKTLHPVRPPRMDRIKENPYWSHRIAFLLIPLLLNTNVSARRAQTRTRAETPSQSRGRTPQWSLRGVTLPVSR